MPSKYDEQAKAKAVRLVTEHLQDYDSEGDCLRFGVTGPDTPSGVWREGPAVTETIGPMAARIDQQQLARKMVDQARGGRAPGR